jgi:DNA-binding transcriptional LysR family regulator
MEVSLRVLRYVVAAADCGNVTAAAHQLRVSQPAVSSAIAELEGAIGAQLFIRQHARGINLTPAGHRVVNEARLLLKHARDFMQTAQEFGGTLTGNITVGSFLTLAVRFMPALLARFAQLHPRIDVTLQEGDQEQLLTMLRSGKIELALAYDFALTDEVEAQSLAELPPFVIVSAKHRLARRRRVSLRELANEPFVLLDLPYSRDYFYGLFRAVDIEPRVVFRTRSQELIRGLVAHGHGYGIQNAIPASTTVYDGAEIAVLAIAETLPPTRIMCLWLNQHALRPAVKAFATFLQESFATGGAFAPGSITAPRIGQMKRR